MPIWLVLGEVAFVGFILFFLLFSFWSLKEKETKAFYRSFLFLLFIIISNLMVFHTPYPLKNWLFGAAFALIMVSISALLFSSKPRKTIEILTGPQKIDERDVIFARFDYREGSQFFSDYYKRKPQYKKTDDEIRRIADILDPSRTKKNPKLFSLAEAEFNFLEHQLTCVDGRKEKEILDWGPEENTQTIKNIIRYLGSDICGICTLNQSYVYSHVGRGPEPIGEKIQLGHKNAIVFAVEMSLDWVALAPKPPVIVETAKRYIEAANISIIVADYIRKLGYSARAHIAGSNYQAMLPPIAWEAGLGELGRLGTIITWKYGPRSRLGLVTTDLPLKPDKPKVWGIQNFCEKCKKCAINCPAQAIPDGDKVQENGVLKWVLDREECYKFWRRTGTDCAICIYVCPYSKSDNFFHDLIKKMASRSVLAQSLFILGDDIFYGSNPIQKKSPI